MIFSRNAIYAYEHQEYSAFKIYQNEATAAYYAQQQASGRISKYEAINSYDAGASRSLETHWDKGWSAFGENSSGYDTYGGFTGTISLGYYSLIGGEGEIGFSNGNMCEFKGGIGAGAGWHVKLPVSIKSLQGTNASLKYDITLEELHGGRKISPGELRANVSLSGAGGTSLLNGEVSLAAGVYSNAETYQGGFFHEEKTSIIISPLKPQWSSEIKVNVFEMSYKRSADKCGP
jgi:hypothetical protein